MKNLKTILSLIIVGTCLLIAYLSYRYYTPPSYRQPYLMNKHKTDTLQIAYIGDSWAFMHKEHECRISQILKDKLRRPVKVHSYGICGATSKEIYEYIFDNSNFKNFLQKRAYTYCVISAGINDTYKKMSISYYQHSMDGIIQFFLSNKIRPIILEIPDYNTMKSFDRQKYSRKGLRFLSMLVNNTPIDCKQDFRDALDELISSRGYQHRISIVRYKSWNKDYLNDLNQKYLEDGMHLNNNGYAKLDSVIANVILALQITSVL